LFKGLEKMAESKELLGKYGFKKVGRWYIKDDTHNLDFEFYDEQDVEELKNKRVIYAFVFDKEVKYIGICKDEKTTLENRMEKYKNKQGGGTNERIHYEIKNCLINRKVNRKRKKEVEIYAIEVGKKEELVRKIAETIEDKDVERLLIIRFDPVWNKEYREKWIKFSPTKFIEIEVRILYK
jgi:hypothetical protein